MNKQLRQLFESLGAYSPYLTQPEILVLNGHTIDIHENWVYITDHKDDKVICFEVSRLSDRIGIDIPI